MRHLLFSFCFLCILFSCEEDTYIAPSEAYRIVINGFLESDSTARVTLSQSIAMIDTGLISSQDFQNATASISYGESNTENLAFVPEQANYWGFDWSSGARINYYAPTLVPLAGQQYTINVSSPGLPDAYATTTMPEFIDFQIADTNVVVDYNPDFDIETNIVYFDLLFKDPEENSNYYLINLYHSYLSYTDGVESVHHSSSYSELKSSDPVVEVFTNHGTINLGVAFSDKTFSGQQKRIKISGSYRDDYVEHNLWDTDSIKIQLNVKFSSINKDYFQYLETLDKFNENRKSPFYPPVQVFSNVEGGYGVFAGASVAVKSIEF